MKQSFSSHRPAPFRATLFLLGFLSLSVASRSAPPPCGGDLVSRCWTGAVSGNWSNPNNWDPIGVPQNGELLRFDDGSRTTMVNDLAGLSLKAMWLFDHDYVLSGNPLTLSSAAGALDAFSGIHMIGGSSHSVTISCPLILGNDAVFAAGCSPDTFGPNITLNVNAGVNLNGHRLVLDAEESGGRIRMSGSISGDGDVELRDTSVCDPTGLIEFTGPTGNTFTGALKIFRSSQGAPTITFNKQSGFVVTNRLELHGGFVLNLDNPGQIGDDVTVVIHQGSRLNLNGNDKTIGSLIMTNVHADAAASLVDTTGPAFGSTGILTLKRGLTSFVFNDSVVPAIRGILSLPPGDHPFHITTPGAFTGLDMQAQIIGQGGFTKTGNAALLLPTSNTFNGLVVVNEGTVEARNSRAFGAGGSGVQLNGGTVNLRNVAIAAESLTVTAPGSSLLAFGACSWAGSIALNQPLTVFSDNFNVSGVITGTGDLSLLGGLVELSGSSPNTFTGATRVNCERLTLNKSPTGAAFAFSGPLLIGQDSFAPNEVRWLNDSQINRTSTRVTLGSRALMNLNGHNDTIGSLTFTGGTVQNNGAGTLSLSQTITANVASVTANISGGRLAIAAGNRFFTVDDGPLEPDLAISAIILDFGGITKSGLGTLRLSGANTFLGAVNLNAGTIHIQSDTALGSTASRTTVADGATLQVESVAALNEPLFIRGAGRGGTNGALHLLPVTGVQAGIVLEAAATVRNDSSFAILSGVISGTGPFTKIGAGSLQFGGGSGGANTYTGDTIVAEGVLVPFKGTGVTTIPGHLIIGTGSGVVGPSATVRHLSGFTIIGSVTVNRGGLWDLNGQSEGWGVADLQGRPPLTLNGGGDVQTGAGIFFLPAGGDVAVNPGGLLGGSSSISGRVGLDPGPHRFVVGSGPGIIGFDFPELDVSAAISQTSTAADLVKEGAGEMRLGAANSFTGPLTVNAGRLTAAHASALGTTAAGTFVNSNASLALDGGIDVRDESLTLDSTNAAAFASLGPVTNVWSGPIILQRTAGINVPDARGGLTHSGIAGFGTPAPSISGPGGFTKSGPGALFITGLSGGNSYTGPTTVTDGLLEATRRGGRSLSSNIVVTGSNSTLRTGRTSANPLLSANTVLPTGAGVTVRDGAQWILTENNAETIAGLRGDGVIRFGSLIGATNGILTVSNTVSCEFSGALRERGGLFKRGPATLLLSGDSPGFFGAAMVFGGTLVVNGKIPSAAVTVKTGSQLRGDGVVGDLTAVEQDSVVRVDASFAEHPERQTGDLEVDDLTMAAGGVVAAALFGPSPTGGNDLLIARGAVTLNNARLSAGFLYPPREGDVAMLLKKNSAGPISGNFGGFPEGITRKLGDVTVRATYLGGDGNDFTLTVTNLPLAFASYRLAEGNGNQTVEPDECNLLFVSLTNRRATSLTITSAVLRAVTDGVSLGPIANPRALVTIASATYPAIPADASRENLTPFQFRTDATLPCGSPVTFELVLGVAGEGECAILFSPASGNDCARPTGGCESCFVVSGQFTTNTPGLVRSLNFIGAPSICDPPKRCPETNSYSDLLAFPTITHAFTNSTTNELCLTAQLRFDCPDAPTNALGAAAYRGANDVHGPCVAYLGDTGGDGTQPFSFRVPPATNFVILVSARATNVVCPRYTLELFGLPCPPLRLHIIRDATPDKVLLQWSTAYPGFQLQTTNVLIGAGSNGFAGVAAVPAVVAGKYSVTNSVALPGQFFRLAR
jgi:autotransporter-associated beta strand protein